MKRLLPLLLLAACSSTTTTSGVEVVDPGTAQEVSTLVLRADGLALSDGIHEEAPLPFGTGTSVVVPALAADLGEPGQEVRACPRGSRTEVTAPGLTVLFDGDRFVGWSATGTTLRTDDGLHVGSPRPPAAPPGLTVEGAATVTRLSAGETCD